MNENYLPTNASITQACEWLQNETDEVWTLARLIEHGLMPWFWLDYRADADAVFAGRKQGYLAPLCFAGDAGRLANGSREVLVTMTRNHAGEIIGLPPGSLVLPLDDVRFMRDDITQLVSKLDAPAAKGEAAERGITKGAVINAFEGVYFDRSQWTKALGKNIPNWLKVCRAMPGIQGSKVSATWNPVLIAAALYGEEGKGISIKKLDAVFVGLKGWDAEWQETSAPFRD